ncbi:MAG: AtpZ/AtpI family protein [Bryobacterales bacterium]|nr:AtpZ/AtpI family protein [Bryobacterales bacterium]
MSPWAKAGAYMGLAFIVPISGFICYWLGAKVGGRTGGLIGLLLGIAAGMYEVYRQAMRIEGFDKK